MSTPRIKRQFAGDSSQRPITDFFSLKPLAVDRASARPASTGASPQTAVGPPQLPASVQTNLLSVGMRVRKSVPEGYKTGSQYGSFKLWSDEATHRPGSCLRPSPHRELVPFCGIHRVGGLAVPPSSPSSSSLPVPIPGLDEMPELTMSQESAADWTPPTLDRGPRTRKRAHDLEVSAAVDAELVPRSRDALHATKTNSPTGSSTGWDSRRVLAARKPRKSIPAYGLPESGQENVMVDDFEEAEFLDVASIVEIVEMETY